MADAVQAVESLMNAAVTSESLTAVPVGSHEYNEVIEWLYREAALLDRGEFAGWFELLTADIIYEMPTRLAVQPKDGTGFIPDFGFFAENHSSLMLRVKRLQTDQAWAEQPRSRTRHIVSNILIDRDSNSQLHVRLAFLITRNRSNRPTDLITGERCDVLRRDARALKLARRTILIDQTVLETHNLSFLF